MRSLGEQQDVPQLLQSRSQWEMLVPHLLHSLQLSQRREQPMYQPEAFLSAVPSQPPLAGVSGRPTGASAVSIFSPVPVVSGSVALERPRSIETGTAVGIAPSYLPGLIAPANRMHVASSS